MRKIQKYYETFAILNNALFSIRARLEQVKLPESDFKLKAKLAEIELAIKSAQGTLDALIEYEKNKYKDSVK